MVMYNVAFGPPLISLANAGAARVCVRGTNSGDSELVLLFILRAATAASPEGCPAYFVTVKEGNSAEVQLPNPSRHTHKLIF